MIQTQTGREMVGFLCKTASRIRIRMSNDIGIVRNKGEYGMLFGIMDVPYNSEEIAQNGETTQKYQDITIYKGSFEFARDYVSKGIYSLEGQNVELWYRINDEDDYEPYKKNNTKRLKEEIVRSKENKPIPQNYFDLFNSIGVHEAVHTMPENHKTNDKEKVPDEKELQTREEQIGVPRYIIDFYEKTYAK